MTIDQPKPKRQNRTVTLHLGNTLSEYETTYLSEAGIKALLGRVEIADTLILRKIGKYVQNSGVSIENHRKI